MYLQALSDLPLDRLELAFHRAIRDCRFLPTIAEIRDLEAIVEIPKSQQQRIDAAYERLKQKVLTQPEPNALVSALDEKTEAKPRRPIRLLTEAEHEAAIKRLREQVKE